jgi:hypothetical protein
MLTFHRFVELPEGIPKPLLGLPNLERAATNHTTTKLISCLPHESQICRTYLMHAYEGCNIEQEKHKRSN